MKKFLKVTAIIITALVLTLVLYLFLNPQFGGSISKEEKAIFKNSSQWDGEKFNNAVETSMDLQLKNLPGLLKNTFKGRSERGPKEALPMIKFDKEDWMQDTADFKFIWFGHSTGLMKFANKNILIDPMFGGDASPVGPFRTKRYTDSTLYIIDLLPSIDVVCITHDHYDHLDYESFKKLKGKVGHFYVPLGVKRHLLRWGIEENSITEFDWWNEATIEGLTMTFVPSRHFSGRGMNDRFKTLWGGWTFVSDAHKIYWSGDGGYGPHFKEIGEKIGPFNWAFLECGQYNKLWHDIHMYPEESIQAAIDVKAKTSIPIHWGAFTLALHHWQDPVKRFSDEAKTKNVHIAMPELGEVVAFDSLDENQFWWESFR
jgi:L-ascorbate metabolism protein UlaG (beta-lactamase superfamily)